MASLYVKFFNVNYLTGDKCLRSPFSVFGIVHDGVTFGSHPIVIRFMKCIYNLRPPIPRYIHTWNVSIVLKELRHLSPVK
jgi:hypothetical protein